MPSSSASQVQDNLYRACGYLYQQMAAPGSGHDPGPRSEPRFLLRDGAEHVSDR